MRWHKKLLEHATIALAQVLNLEYPADGVMSRYFRENPDLGHADRGLIAEAVYAVLRHLRSLATATGAGNEAKPRQLMLALLVMREGLNLRQLEELLKPDEREWLTSVKAFDRASLTPARQNELPDWLHDRLAAQLGETATAELATSLNRPAPLDLRVNTIKTTRDEALAALRESGIAGEPTPYSPFGIRLAGKPSLARHPLFLDGRVEVQDEGSQLLGLLLGPKRGEMVTDFCAGAGGKTLLLGALMRSTGRLYAFDIAEKRLAKLKPRLARSGLSNVHAVRIEHENDTKVKRLVGKMDRVLVDAPCSGLGTLRRNPDLKWRQSPEAVERLGETQAAILASAARLLKKGGTLVYATCSVLAEENDLVVDAFLAAHPAYVQRNAGEMLAKQGIEIPGERMRLSPATHGTDGFFAAVLERI